MARSIQFSVAAEVGQRQLHPQHRISQLSLSRQVALMGDINPMSEQARKQAMLSFVHQHIETLDNTAPLLSRIGAYVLLFSQIENRLRAMYRQRHAMMHGLPAPQTTQASPDNAGLNDRVETLELQRVMAILRDYEDIDADTANELQLFIQIRNKTVHQALYRTNAFQPDIIPALLELYNHMVRVRARLTTRLKKERQLYNDPTQVQQQIRQRIDHIQPHAVITREDLFGCLAGSTSLHVPVVAGQPLYLVAKHAPKSKSLVVNVTEESSQHNMWNAIVEASQPYVIFQKQYRTSASLVQRLGDGHIVSVVHDNQGKIKQLNVELVPTH